jgi:hypothetical protein
MNAQVTWDRLLTAYAVGDWDNIEACAGGLRFWLDCGGSPPRVVAGDDLDEFNRALAEAGCRHAQSVLREHWTIHAAPAPAEVAGTAMRVDPKYGRCRSCDSTLHIVEADDTTVTVKCGECTDSYELETHSLGGGCYAGITAKTTTNGGT